MKLTHISLLLIVSVHARNHYQNVCVAWKMPNLNEGNLVKMQVVCLVG